MAPPVGRGWATQGVTEAERSRLGNVPRGDAARGTPAVARRNGREVARPRTTAGVRRGRTPRPSAAEPVGPVSAILFIVRPQADDFDRSDVLKHLIDEAVLDVDAA